MRWHFYIFQMELPLRLVLTANFFAFRRANSFPGKIVAGSTVSFELGGEKENYRRPIPPLNTIFHGAAAVGRG